MIAKPQITQITRILRNNEFYELVIFVPFDDKDKTTDYTDFKKQ